MASYVKSTNFAVKDGLPSGDPLKVVKGTEIDTEFNNIATAVQSKADISSPTFLGTPFAPTAATGTNTTQIATTAFVQAQKEAERTATATLTNKTLTAPTITTPVLTTPKVDVINENTSDAGVTVDGVLLKDGNVTATLTGNVTGDVTGNVTGNVTGDVTGNAGTVTTVSTSQVLSAVAGASVGAVGTYAFLRASTSTSYAAGATLAGSSLKYAGVSGNENGSYDNGLRTYSSGTPSGTWRCMGRSVFSADGFDPVEYFFGATLWLRIS